MLGGAKQLADFVAALPADAAFDPASEQQIDATLGALSTILSRRGDILATF